jgi:ligand-binding sensor domain-containing protein
VYAVASDPMFGTTYLATDNGILRYDGTSWALETTGYVQVSFTYAMLVTDTHRLFVGGRNLLTSDDGGLTYQERWAPDITGSTQVNAIAVSGTRTWAGTGSGIAYSDDLSTWTVVQGLSDYYVNALAAPDDQTVIAGTTSGVVISTDDGASFQVANTGLTNLAVFAIVQMNGVYVAGTGDGVWTASDPSAGWQRAGLAGTTIDGLFVDGASLMAATSVGVRTTSDLMTWQPIRGLDDNKPASIGLAASGDVYVGTYGYGAYRLLQ